MDYGLVAMLVVIVLWNFVKWYCEETADSFYRPPSSYAEKPRRRRRRRVVVRRKRKAAVNEPPPWIICGDVSPDNVLRCRLEVGHGGWHSHHGPVCWYGGQWAEDDFRYDWRKHNIPW